MAIRIWASVLLFWLGLAAQATAAEPYTPASDAEVLAKVPPRAAPGPSALAGLRQQLAARPDDPGLAARYAAEVIAVGRASADPRYFGYAQAALSSWWSQAEPPAAVRLQRAILLQRQHQYAAALRDLDGLIAGGHDDPAARLNRAAVHLAQGRAAEAQRDCAALIGKANLLIATTCLAASGGVSGQAGPRYRSLLAMLATPAAEDAAAGERRWAWTVAAELAVQQGLDAEADRAFDQARALAAAEAVDDVYLQAAWADHGLALGRTQEVATVLKDSVAEVSLLRLALAGRRLAEQGDLAWQSRWPGIRDRLVVRFAQARERGETGHGREEAMLALYLLDQPAEALRLARDNWALQREPVDARILLESARATRDEATLIEVRDWLRSTRLEDPALRRLAGLAPTEPGL